MGLVFVAFQASRRDAGAVGEGSFDILMILDELDGGRRPGQQKEQAQGKQRGPDFGGMHARGLPEKNGQ